jgi:hypothetical protein
MREHRARRHRGALVLPLLVTKADLKEIALQGYASTDPKVQAEAVALLLSDTVYQAAAGCA